MTLKISYSKKMINVNLITTNTPKNIELLWHYLHDEERVCTPRTHAIDVAICIVFHLNTEGLLSFAQQHNTPKNKIHPYTTIRYQLAQFIEHEKLQYILSNFRLAYTHSPSVKTTDGCSNDTFKKSYAHQACDHLLILANLKIAHFEKLFGQELLKTYTNNCLTELSVTPRAKNALEHLAPEHPRYSALHGLLEAIHQAFCPVPI